MTDSQDAPGMDARRPPPQQSLRSEAQAGWRPGSP